MVRPAGFPKPVPEDFASHRGPPSCASLPNHRATSTARCEKIRQPQVIHAVNQVESNALVMEVHEPPLQPDQEWANALTHAIATLGTLLIGCYMVLVASDKGVGLAMACGVYIASAFGTFLFSTLSHFITRQPALNTLRAWDQAMIYAMISGTYTPIAFAYSPERVKLPLLAALWIAAGAGFLHKVAFRHRINSIGTISYLLLGWLPAIPLAGNVPTHLAWSMIAGGFVYTIGVIALLNDQKMRYMHALWHLCVMMAATLHYIGILRFVVEAA